MVDLTSTSWTGAQRLHWREQVTPPLAIVSLFFCVLAAIIYCIPFKYLSYIIIMTNTIDLAMLFHF
jgi:hypothetical protein